MRRNFSRKTKQPDFNAIKDTRHVRCWWQNGRWYGELWDEKCATRKSFFPHITDFKAYDDKELQSYLATKYKYAESVTVYGVDDDASRYYGSREKL